jgi:membrane protein required for colicin V production
VNAPAQRFEPVAVGGSTVPVPGHMSIEDLGLGWVDLAMAVSLLFSVAVGAMRGLVFEVTAIVGWFVAYFVALWAAPLLAPHVPIGSQGSLLNQAVTFASAFIATLIVWGFLSRLLRKMIRATPLAPVDRVLGAGFGLFRGLLVLLVLAAVVSYTPAARAPWWQESVAAGWLTSLLRIVRPLLPGEMRSSVSAQAGVFTRGNKPCAG